MSALYTLDKITVCALLIIEGSRCIFAYLCAVLTVRETCKDFYIWTVGNPESLNDQSKVTQDA